VARLGVVQRGMATNATAGVRRPAMFSPMWALYDSTQPPGSAPGCVVLVGEPPADFECPIPSLGAALDAALGRNAGVS
jgi:hypothetical protein